MEALEREYYEKNIQKILREKIDELNFLRRQNEIKIDDVSKLSQKLMEIQKEHSMC